MDNPNDRDDRMTNEILEAFRPLAEMGGENGMKGRQPSEFRGGPLDGHKQFVPAGHRRIVYRRAIYLAEMSGDYSFIGFEPTPSTPAAPASRP